MLNCHREKQSQHIHEHNDRRRHRETEDHPFGLLALSWTGHPTVAVELDEGNRGELAQKHEPVKLEKRGFQLERRIGEEGERDLHSQKHDERPAHPRRDEPPTGEQEEDKQEEG